MDNSVLTCILYISFTQATAWTVDLNEARNYYNERNDAYNNRYNDNGYNDNDDRYVPNYYRGEDQENYVNYPTYPSDYRGGLSRDFNEYNNIGPNAKYANEYEYQGYMEKKILDVVRNGTAYLDGLHRAIEQYIETLENCTTWNRMNTNLTVFRNSTVWTRPNLNESLFEGNMSDCERVSQTRELVRRLAQLALWATRELQDRAYQNQYQPYDHRINEQEDEIILKLALFLDRLANLTGFDPNPQDFTTKPPTTTSTSSPPVIGIPVPPEVVQRLMRCMEGNSTGPSIDRCSLPIPAVIQQIIAGIRANTSLPSLASGIPAPGGSMPPGVPPTSSPTLTGNRQPDLLQLLRERFGPNVNVSRFNGTWLSPLPLFDANSSLPSFPSGILAPGGPMPPGVPAPGVPPASPPTLTGNKQPDLLQMLRQQFGPNFNVSRFNGTWPSPLPPFDGNFTFPPGINPWRNFTGQPNGGEFFPTNMTSPRPVQKRSIHDNPLTKVMKYYVKHKVWTNSNAAAETEDKEKKNSTEFDIDNDLTHVKSVQKRSIKKKSVGYQPKTLVHVISEHLKHKISSDLLKKKHRVQEIRHVVRKIQDTVSRKFVRKLEHVKHYHKRSVNYGKKSLPRIPENPQQDISYYVKNKEGTNYNPSLLQATQSRLYLEQAFQMGNIEVIRRFGSNPVIPGHVYYGALMTVLADV